MEFRIVDLFLKGSNELSPSEIMEDSMIFPIVALFLKGSSVMAPSTTEGLIVVLFLKELCVTRDSIGKLRDSIGV